MKKLLIGLVAAFALLAPQAHASILGIATSVDVNNVQTLINDIERQITHLQKELSTDTLGGSVVNPGGGGGAVSSLTTTGISGSSTLSGGVLNIPVYTGGGVATGTVVTLGSPLTVSGSATATIFGTPSSSYIININTRIQFPTAAQLAASGCNGSSTITDAGACVNYIYQKAVSSTELDFPTSYYSYVTQIVATTSDKNFLFQGVPGGGTEFHYAGTTGVAWSAGSGNAPHTGDGIAGIKLDCTNTGTATGFSIGSSNTNAGEGFLLKDSFVTNCFHNIVLGNNVYLFVMDHSYSRFNVSGGDLILENGSVNSGETLGFINGTLFSDGQPAAGAIHLQTSGATNIEFNVCSIDDAQLLIDEYGGQGNQVVVNQCNFENPGGDSIPKYTYVEMNTGNPFLNDSVVLTNNKFQNDATTNRPDYFIDLYGKLTLTGNDFDDDGGGSVNAAVNIGETSSTIYSAGNTTGDNGNGPGAIYLYGTKPLTGGVQTYNVTSTFDGPTVFYTAPTDANGNKFSTSSSGGLSGLSTGYLQLANSPTTLGTSSIYQSSSTYATIAVDATDTFTSSPASTTLTISHTITSTGTNRFLVVGAFGTNMNNVTATYNGVTMTQTSLVLGTDTRYLAVYVLPNPATGTHNIVLTASSSEAIFQGFGESYTGVNQTTTVDATTTVASGTQSLSYPTTLTTVSNNDWSFLIGRQNGGFANGVSTSSFTNITLRAQSSPTQPFTIWGDSGGPISPPQPFTMTFNSNTPTNTAGYYSAMVAFAPALISTGTTVTGFGTTNPQTAFDFQGPSSTLFIQCFKTLDHSTSSIVYNWLYSSSTALVVTATKPTFCQ